MSANQLRFAFPPPVAVQTMLNPRRMWHLASELAKIVVRSSGRTTIGVYADIIIPAEAFPEKTLAMAAMEVQPSSAVTPSS